MALEEGGNSGARGVHAIDIAASGIPGTQYGRDHLGNREITDEGAGDDLVHAGGGRDRVLGEAGAR